MKIQTKILLLAVLGMSLIACSSSNSGVQYTDPTEVDNTSINFGSTDLQTTAQKMVDGLLTFPPIVQLTSKHSPIVFVDTIQNQTSEQINTDNISNMVMTQLIQSGKFRFVDPSVVKQVHGQMSYQQSSGLVNPASAMKVGTQVGAQFMLYGSITSMQSSNSKMTSMYYLITMKLLNLKTGIVEWADQKQIRKVQR